MTKNVIGTVSSGGSSMWSIDPVYPAIAVNLQPYGESTHEGFTSMEVEPEHYTTTLKPLSLSDVALCTRAVLDYCRRLNCPIFNRKLPSEAWFRDYIHSQSNTVLIDQDIGLSDSTHGAVIKKRIELESGTVRYLYFIYVSNHVKDKVSRLFTFAHEIAHVLLHGRILQSGMLLARRDQDWYYAAGRKMAQQMELEANLFALFCLIPTSLIECVYENIRKFTPGSNSVPSVTMARIVRSVLENLYGCSVDIQLVRERLFVHEYLYDNNENDVNSISLPTDSHYPFPHSPWLLNGPHNMEHPLNSNHYRENRRYHGLVKKISEWVTPNLVM